MPETAKVLPFRLRPSAPQSQGEAEALARTYLVGVGTDGEEERREALLDRADALLSVCTALRGLVDGNASLVEQESVALYRTIGSRGQVGSFDERDYFLGETALIAEVDEGSTESIDRIVALHGGRVYRSEMV